MRFFICISGLGCCSSHVSDSHFFNRLIYIEAPNGCSYVSILQKKDHRAVRGSGYVNKYQVKELKVRREI
jgi:hypothetical protein